MGRKGFTLIELLIVVAIIGILAAVGAVVIPNVLEKTKINAAKANHKNVVNIVKTSLAQCDIGQQLILKKNPTTNTSNLCPLVSSGNVNQLAIHFVAHFKSLAWCNPFGWMGGSICAEAVEAGGTVGEGNVGATKLITKSNSKIIFIDTKYTCGNSGQTENCRTGETLTDTINF